jgi:hypothetical protein
MKKSTLILIILLSLYWSFGQDYRVLQKDKNKLFISTIRSGDSILQVAIIHADWRLDYVQKNFSRRTVKMEYGDPQDSATLKPKHKIGHIGIAASGDDHHGKEQMVHSFYVDMENSKSVNEIFKLINNEYRSVTQMDDDNYRLIKNFLPDSAAEYYVDAYKGSNTAAIEVIYLWGAPLRGWQVGFAVSVHDREARKVLNGMLCMGPNDTELGVRKIRIRQANLLEVMSYSDMFCQ